ncbi:MAG: phosphatase PAP2 family protein [Sphingomonas sp.]|uniref:phosphatase PAP2 family protein n=1 Tax=Sphingomonas sp. TaxID=28214 RepID=UPI00183014CB|nr:phosphatase PAP2 family protein [Sphingomonas sp.]MBA3666455.1 phosphatase PAP2 family protein [Sphingomonas sp.]
MARFSSPRIAIVLIFVFVTAGWVGGPANLYDDEAVRTLAFVRGTWPPLSSAAVAFTQLGSAYATLGLAAVAALWLWRQGHRRKAAFLAAAVASERLAADGLKLLFDRSRPAFDLHPVTVSSSSFPSGHAANSMAVFLLVALIAVDGRHRRLAVTLALVMALLIGLSRPFLGVHWPSDVVGGWALGMLAVWVAIAAARGFGLEGSSRRGLETLSNGREG